MRFGLLIASIMFLLIPTAKQVKTSVKAVTQVEVIEVEVSKSFEQTLLEKLPRNIQKNAKTYLPAIVKIARAHDLDPLWVLSIVWTESHFKTHAKSSVGARGLMQLMPNTRKYVYLKYRKAKKKLLVEHKNFKLEDYHLSKTMSKKRHIKNLVNIEIGVIYLKRLFNRFGSRKLATVAYNMGPTWTSRKLRNKQPVGNRNIYLAKVDRALAHLKSQI